MQHMCAVMLLDGTVSFKSSHDEKRMRDRRVLAVSREVQLLGDDAMSAAMPSRQGIVELELATAAPAPPHAAPCAEPPITR
jgi:2-methylcitrate dehydratase PrpD